MVSEDMFKEKLDAMPPTGGGCHAAMMGAASIGVLAGLTDCEIYESIRNSIKGTRKVPDYEINKTISKARSDHGSVEQNRKEDRTPYVRPKRHSPVKPIFDGKKELNRMIKQAKQKWGEYSPAELWELSPVRLYDRIEDDAKLLLDTLYQPDDFLFIGSQYSKHVKTVTEWLNDEKLTDNSYIIPNTLCGEQRLNKSGSLSFRSDACVVDHRFAVVEFDEIPIEQQTAFWLSTKLPVCVIIHSGGKSLHGWVKTGVDNAKDWDIKIREELFNYLVPIGADKSCKNPARLSRLPGHFRSEKHNFQQILYLSPNGEPPCQI